MIFIDATETDFPLKNAGKTMKVQELIKHLCDNYDYDNFVYLSFDDNTVFGSLKDSNISTDSGMVFIKAIREEDSVEKIDFTMKVHHLVKLLKQFDNWDDVYFDLGDGSVYANITKEKIVRKN